MKALDKHLKDVVCYLVLGCVVSVSFAFSLETHKPFESIKELLFHFFVLLGCFFLVVRALLTNAWPIKKDLLNAFVFLYLCYNILSFALSPNAERVYLINQVLFIQFYFVA